MCKLSSTDWGNVAQWVGASCTLLASCIALFKEDILRWKCKPVLSINIQLTPPDCNKTNLIFNNLEQSLYSQPASGFGSQGSEPGNTSSTISIDSYYLRLLIKNGGNAPADRVQVYAESLLKKQDDSTFLKVDSFIPMNLRWSHSNEIYADVIHPQMYKHCDLGYILNPSNRAKVPTENIPDINADKTILSLALEVKAITLNNLVPPGLYKLCLIVVGANSKPLSTSLEINITGDWFPNERRMFSDGIGIRVL